MLVSNNFGPRDSNIVSSDSTQASAIDNKTNSFYDFVDEIPMEAVAYAVAAMVVRIFSPVLALPIVGISVGIFATKLALKIWDYYNRTAVKSLTEKTCAFDKRNPHLQLVASAFALGISALSQPLAFLSGLAIGSYSATLFDMKYHRYVQFMRRLGHVRHPDIQQT